MRKLTIMGVRFIVVVLVLWLAPCISVAQVPPAATVEVGLGWANNSVNAVIFRKNSLVTYRDTQYIAYYDKDRYVVLGKRRTGEKHWQLKRTGYQGNANDAHNAISIMVDGAGFLHLSWDHHNNPLNYCKSIYPGSLELTDRLPMTGSNEQKVAYPEFYKMPGGELFFFYRNGASGNGSLVINKYDLEKREWISVQQNLIDGEGQRNAYWQACTDDNGTIHISWVWRESPDVASNHDICYARSKDGGTSWEQSSGKKYQLPITSSTAEYICRVPQKSELINQTSMIAYPQGNIFIASYWKATDDPAPQYKLVHYDGKKWSVKNTGFRNTDFTLSGMGTRRIPISRPQVIAWSRNKQLSVAVIFRDAERSDRISLASNSNLPENKWVVTDLADERVGAWEPSFDTELWRRKKILNLFVQPVEQGNAEGIVSSEPAMVTVLEWIPPNE